MRHVTRSLSSALLLALFLAFVASPAFAESEPAVREANFRVGADYTWLHFFSDDVFQFRPGPRTLVSVPEVDIDDGGFTGTYVMPLEVLGPEFGLRVFGGPRFTKTHPDVLEETKTYGLTTGGEVFWRDPNVGEIGAGTFYAWDESRRGSEMGSGNVNRSNHEAGLNVFGKAFFGTPGEGLPVDLDVNLAFSDADIDSGGANSANRTYAANGGARVYFNDHTSFRLGADYSRTNLGQTDYVENILATMDLEILLPTERNVVIGGGFIVGDRTESFIEFQQYGRLVFGISLNATISFTGAESLAELRRNFF
ncbi:MAG: hypothetical protein AAGC67_07015 [Myxococcota bacterium]